jgi:hypothetical protein
MSRLCHDRAFLPAGAFLPPHTRIRVDNRALIVILSSALFFAFAAQPHESEWLLRQSALG